MGEKEYHELMKEFPKEDAPTSSAKVGIRRRPLSPPAANIRRWRLNNLASKTIWGLLEILNSKSREDRPVATDEAHANISSFVITYYVMMRKERSAHHEKDDLKARSKGIP